MGRIEKAMQIINGRLACGCESGEIEGDGASEIEPIYEGNGAGNRV